MKSFLRFFKKSKIKLNKKQKTISVQKKEKMMKKFNIFALIALSLAVAGNVDAAKSVIAPDHPYFKPVRSLLHDERLKSNEDGGI